MSRCFCGEVWSTSSGPGRVVGAIARSIVGVQVPLPDDFTFEYCAACEKRNLTPELEARFLEVERVALARSDALPRISSPTEEPWTTKQCRLCNGEPIAPWPPGSTGSGPTHHTCHPGEERAVTACQHQWREGLSGRGENVSCALCQRTAPKAIYLLGEVDRLREVAEKAEAKASQYMADWVAAKYDFGTSMAKARTALVTINAIRNSIIGTQTVNWSEHVYPIIAALDAAGMVGVPYETARANAGTLIERATKAEAEVERLRAVVDAVRAYKVADDRMGDSPALLHEAELRWSDVCAALARLDEKKR